MLYDYPKEFYTRDRKKNPPVASLEYFFEEADEQAYGHSCVSDPGPMGFSSRRERSARRIL